jgi:hypothetical protein
MKTSKLSKFRFSADVDPAVPPQQVSRFDGKRE